MKTLLRNIAAVVLGFVVALVVNKSLIDLAPHVIAPPAGLDMTTLEGVTAAMPLLEPRHFIFPFLAHALGTLVGAFVAAMVAASNRMKFALAIGVLNLLAGIAAVAMIPAPLWFEVVDLAFAYIPMGILGGMLALRIRPDLR